MSGLGTEFRTAGDFASGPITKPARAPSSRSKTKFGKTSPRVTLRLTPEEHAKLTELAHGLTLSAYIRACLFGSKVAPRKRKKREPVKDEKAVAELLGLLGQSRIANNLNQLAYRANTGSLLLDDHSLGMITEAHDHVRFMRSQLVVALGIADVRANANVST
ncbi:MAG: plasmid mobilization relaxosome protein MobC [Pseudomonadota bacterium]